MFLFSSVNFISILLLTNCTRKNKKNIFGLLKAFKGLMSMFLKALNVHVYLYERLEISFDKQS